MVISIVNQKGGVGKTTIAVNLAVAYARAKHKVILVDADKQGSAASFSVIRQAMELPHFTHLLHVMPDLHELDFGDNTVIIDVGGSDSNVFRSAIYASDLIIMPLTPSSLDVWGSEVTLKIIAESNNVRTENGLLPSQLYGLLNMVMPRTNLNQDIRDILKDIEKDYRFKFLKTELGARVIYKKAVNEGLGVFETKDAKAFKEMKDLFNEVRGICKKLNATR